MKKFILVTIAILAAYCLDGAETAVAAFPFLMAPTDEGGKKEDDDEVTADALKALVLKFNESQDALKAKQTELETALESKATEEVITGMKTEIEGLKTALVNANAILVKQGEFLQKSELDVRVKSKTPETFAEKLADAVEASGKMEAFKKGEISKLKLTVKDAFSSKTIDIADVQNNTMGTRIMGIGKQPVRNIVIEPLFSSASAGADSNGVIKYIDQDVLTRNAATVQRCNPVPESDINWIERSCPIEKIGDSIPVCRDALEDLSFLESELRNYLLENVALELDNQLLLGDGLTPNLKGIDNVAPNWAAGSFATAIPTPSVYDVISTGATQIKVAGQGSFFMPNVVLMNPEDVEEMRLTKDANGNYLIPPFADLGTFTIRGMRIIETTLVPSNQAYLGDFAKGVVYSGRDLEVEVANQHGTDFLSDILRLKATTRKALVIRNVHAGAFLHVPSISQAITDLTKP